MGPKILVINGPNLNMLGIREKEIYGTASLESIQAELNQQARELNLAVGFFQSNHEGALIDRIHEAFQQQVQVLIINAGAFTHYSIAIHDALKAAAIPVIEVHLSNVFQREEFRHQSLISPLAVGGIFGFGALSYRLALMAAADLIAAKESISKVP